jgi:hypothetical protein
VTRDITNCNILTDSGFITSPREVAKHRGKRFSTPEWIEAHKTKKINAITITYVHHDEIVRPVVECKYETLSGSMTAYSYMILAEDQIARRARSCSCADGCMLTRGRPNMESAGDRPLCVGCVHPDKPAWVQQTIKAIATAGVANRRIIAQTEGKKWAQALRAPTAEKPGDGFMAIQARERWSGSEDNHFRPGHFWLAQVGDVLHLEKIDKRCTIEGVTCSSGDYFVRIGRYFDRDASDASGLTFEE